MGPTTPRRSSPGTDRISPGRFLAHEDIKHLVARVLHRFDAELLGPLPALDQRRAGLGVLPPRGELMVRLRPRA